MTAGAYPVRMDGQLDPALSRWLWLVKWLLVIPHYVVLFFLWVAFVVLTMIAFFAILLTGRYPRVLFDFSVGVLRWTWRVNYYAYDGLGTDRYPPFTLADVPDYPAHFDVDYPEHLSRGLVLVKWWLLALPHLLIVAVLVGGGTWVAWQTSDSRWSWGGPSGGLIGLLVLIAAITLAVTGRYPQSLFDLILGLDQWVLRVAAYVTLMTDQYPPFRLDLGGPDPARGLDGPGLAAPSPGTAVGTSAAGPGANDSSPGRSTPGGVSVATGATPAGPVGVAPPAYPSGGGTAGRVVALVVGVLLTLLGLMLVLAGAAAGWLNSQRDADGFLTSGTASIGTPTAALATKGIDVRVEGSDWLYAPQRLGTVRLHAQSPTGKPLFLGVARESDLAAWLRGIGHDQVRDVSVAPFSVSYLRQPGDLTSAPAPTGQRFWAAATSGAGGQVLSWQVSEGRWAIVVANADGTPGVDARVRVAARVPGLAGLAIGLVVAGVAALAVGALLIIHAARSRGRAGSPPSRTPGASPAAGVRGKGS